MHIAVDRPPGPSTPTPSISLLPLRTHFSPPAHIAALPSFVHTAASRAHDHHNCPCPPVIEPPCSPTVAAVGARPASPTAPCSLVAARPTAMTVPSLVAPLTCYPCTAQFRHPPRPLPLLLPLPCCYCSWRCWPHAPLLPVGAHRRWPPPLACSPPPPLRLAARASRLCRPAASHRLASIIEPPRPPLVCLRASLWPPPLGTPLRPPPLDARRP